MKDEPVNILSFDVEHWYTARLLREDVTDPADRIVDSVEATLDILRGHDVSATFFVVGKVAQAYPDLVRRLADAGHEIASHGYTHRSLFELDPETFERELALSVKVLGEITGQRPIGFRAPNFSMSPDTKWAVEILEEYGFQYDSSVFPIRTPMYGVNGVPIEVTRLDSGSPFPMTGSTDGDGLVELPPAVYHPRVRLPVAGGFYARLLPTWILERGIRNLNRRGIPATTYFHPWEFNPSVVTDEVPFHKRFVSFHGVGGLSDKLDRLLGEFEFTTARDVAERATGGRLAATDPADSTESEDTLNGAQVPRQ